MRARCSASPATSSCSSSRSSRSRGSCRCIRLSHEPSVGFAADAAARISCAPGVAAVTYGAGALNMVNPVAAAYAEKSPLVVISGAPGRNEDARRAAAAPPGEAPRLAVRDLSRNHLRPGLLDDPGQAPEQIARVLRNCIVQSRPVYLELPRDRVLRPVWARAAPSGRPDSIPRQYPPAPTKSWSGSRMPRVP